MPRGFTIIEIITAIGLLLLLVGLGYTFSFGYVQTQELRAAADIVASEVRQAQTNAFGQKNDVDHGVKVFTDHVIRFEGTTYASRNQAADVRTEFSSAVTLAGTDEIIFTKGAANPTIASTTTLSHTTLAIDIAISSYGLLTVTERTIGG